MMALSPLDKLAVGVGAGTAATPAHHKQQQQSAGHGNGHGSVALQQLQPQLSPAPCRKQQQQQQQPADACGTTVSPHITRPHRGIPAVLRQQHPAAAAHLLHQQHPAASWRQLLPPPQRHPCQHAQQQQQQQQQHAIVRPRTSSLGLGCLRSTAGWQSAWVDSVPRLLPPRPGSAAASRVLHALAKVQRQHQQHQQEQQQPSSSSSRSSSQAVTAAARPGSRSGSAGHSLLLSCGSAFSSHASSSKGQGQTTPSHALPPPHPGDPAWQRLLAACAAGAISRPPTAAMHAVLAAAAAGPGDGVEATLDAIAASNRSCDDGAGLDIVARGSSSSEQEGFSTLLADDDGDRGARRCMVLSLEQPSDSSLEVLQLELQALELSQLHRLEAALGAGPLFDRPS